MSSIAYRLDHALDALQAQGLTPVTIVLTDADHEALAGMDAWPMTVTARGELRYRSTPVFRPTAGEGGSIVGRGMNGATRRFAFAEADSESARS